MEFVRPVDFGEGAKPSVFDLMAQKSLEKLLPALFSTIPKKAFHGGKAILDLAMLAKFGGITSEVIYGMERKCSYKQGSWLIYVVSLVECHLFPLIAHRLASLPSSLRKFLQILDVLVKLLYISGDCKSFSLLHWCTGVSLKHSTTDIYERTDFPSRMLKWLLVTGQLGVFLLQSGVFDRFIPSRNAKQTRLLTSSIPSIPPNYESVGPQPHPKGLPLPPKAAGICPCCLEQWKVPVAVSTGVIYCRTCIEEKKKCPVTRLSITHFVPLFLQ